MIRKSPGDISDYEYDKYALPQHENVVKYLIRYVAPEVVAFDIASSYFRNALWDCEYKLLVGSALGLINNKFGAQDIQYISSEAKRILEIKYSIKIICDDPLAIRVMTPDNN